MLLLVLIGQTITSSAIKSPTSDERPHIAAGLSYLASGRVELNPEHPPLLKELSALFLNFGGIRWPDDLGNVKRDQDYEWAAGDRIIAGNNPDRAMFWARAPMMLLSTCLGLLIYAWGSQLLGRTAALCALFLFVFDPIILAHSYLVTTDSGFAALTLLYIFTLWQVLDRADWKRLVCCGVALGAAICSKFSGVALAPITAVLVLAWRRWPTRSENAAGGHERVAPVGKSAAGRKFPHVQSGRGATALLMVIFSIAFLVIQAVYLFPADPFLYLRNYSRIYTWENPDYLHFMAGGFATHFYSYLTVAYILKEPVPSIILGLAGLVLVLRDKTLGVRAKLFLLAPPAVLWVGYSVSAKNIGVRYLIPVLPFCFLLGGVAMARLLRNGPVWKRGAGVILAAWVALGSAGIYPDHLSYFNETACLPLDPARIGMDGGTRCGTFWLDDSNVDWGQGMKQLKAWLDKNSAGRPVYLANFTGIPPEVFGIRYQPIDFNRDLILPSRGWYIVSAHYVARIGAQLPPDPRARFWLRDEPYAVVGHAYYVYDLN